MKRTVIRTSFFLGVFIAAVLILLTHCQKNENMATKGNAQTNYIEKVKTWFDANPQLNKFVILKFTGEVNWNNAFYHSRDGQTAVELPLKLKKGITISNNDMAATKTINRLVFLINNKQQIRSFHEMITTNEDINKLSKKINYFSIPRNFTGLVILTNQTRVLKQYRQYKNGKINHFKIAPSIYYCWRIIENFSDGSYRPITEWSCSGGGGGGSNGHFGGGGAGGNGNGNITAKPCRGDPVKNPEIVSSGTSGKKGGTFGCTRKDKKEKCGGVKGLKGHEGLDLKAAPNSNVFSMYDGKVVNLRDSFAPGKYKKDSKGNFILVSYRINGETIYVQYNHLNKVSITKGQIVKAGDIIGLSGTTGNVTKKITPHVHIEVYNSVWKMVNPADYLTTKFDANYNAIPNSNCN